MPDAGCWVFLLAKNANAETKEMLCDQLSSEETAADKPEREVINRKMYVRSSVCAGSGEKPPDSTFWSV